MAASACEGADDVHLWLGYRAVRLRNWLKNNRVLVGRKETSKEV